MSIPNDDCIWISGSRGTVLKSIDGGETFKAFQVKGFEKSDFRDVAAFNDQEAILMSSGTPACLLITRDGGSSWKEVFRQQDTAYFLDAMDFWDRQNGVVVGDPIHGHFVLLQTTDGGNTWVELDTAQTPKAAPDEAVFAASGTSIQCWGKQAFGFVSGGTVSKLYVSQQPNQRWTAFPIQIVQGKASQGTFSFAKTADDWLFAGGDYANDLQVDGPNFVHCQQPGKEPCSAQATEHTAGYKSCLVAINRSLVIATGTSGTEAGYRMSGNVFRFEKIGGSFHVVGKSPSGKTVLFAGPKGKVGKLVW